MRASKTDLLKATKAKRIGKASGKVAYVDFIEKKKKIDFNRNLKLN